MVTFLTMQCILESRQDLFYFFLILVSMEAELLFGAGYVTIFERVTGHMYIIRMFCSLLLRDFRALKGRNV